MDNLLSIKDKLAASSSKRKKKQASRLDKAISRMRRKIKHLQNELHKKSVAFFTREFDAIIIPPFEVSNMINRKTRRITRKTVRKMLCWGHYQFRQRLVAKAEELGVYCPKRGLYVQNLQLVWERSKSRRVRGVQMPELWNCNGSRRKWRSGNLPPGIALILSGDHAGNNSYT